MIFYFTGTGNSLQIAKGIADYSGERLISISKEMNSKECNFEYTIEEDETIGFVFPVYAWAPPKMVLEFIHKMRLKNYKNNYTFSVATCGENIGNTMKVVDSNLKKRGMSLSSGFSVVMPNNYIITYDIDSQERQNKLLKAAEETLEHINKIIGERKALIFEVEKGFMPGILTSVINPLFSKFSLNTKKFSVNDKCTSCRICEKVCNANSIVVNEKPQWGEKCTQCLACLHHCPVKAIQYGKSTEGKGRYTNPKVKQI